MFLLNVIWMNYYINIFCKNSMMKLNIFFKIKMFLLNFGAWELRL